MVMTRRGHTINNGDSSKTHATSTSADTQGCLRPLPGRLQTVNISGFSLLLLGEGASSVVTCYHT